MQQLRAGPAASRRMAPSTEQAARLAEAMARGGAEGDRKRRKRAEERRPMTRTTASSAAGAFCVDWEIPDPPSDGP